LIITFEEAAEVHPAALVTVKVRVPAASPEIVILDPVPVIAPGLMVQFPVGKPLSSTLPVEMAQVVCVIMPIVGADGDAGCALITTFAVATEVQPIELVTVKV
jgi:hypothetical protein